MLQLEPGHLIVINWFDYTIEVVKIDKIRIIIVEVWLTLILVGCLFLRISVLLLVEIVRVGIQVVVLMHHLMID